MKIITLILPFLIFGFICSFAQDKITSSVEKYKQEIIETERAFCKRLQEKGLAEAFLYYATDDVIRLKNKAFPSMNKEEMKKDFEGDDAANSPKLTWEPVKVEVAESGELGYSFGKWVMEEKDEKGNPTKRYGVYVTVWKRQKDGTWKYALDGGTSTPPPPNK